jgi:type III secretion protein T
MTMDPALFIVLKGWLLALLYATVRLQIALVIIPLFSSSVMPALVRTAVGVALALVMVPPLHAQLVAGAPPDTLQIGATVVKEAVLGFFIGYSIAVLFWAIEAIGFFIDNQRGASIASTLNPLTGNDTSPLGILFNQAFIVYFMVAGGFVVFMSVVYQSFKIWPVLTYFPTLTPGGIPVFADMFVGLLRLALLLSAPAIVSMLLAELGLALVSRFAPNLQVFFLAMPIKSGIALFVLVVYLPTLFDYIRTEIGRLPGVLPLLSRGLG